MTTPTFHELERRQLEQQQLVSRCQQHGCRWTFSGPLVEARAAFAAHLAEQHPNLVQRRKPVRSAQARMEDRLRRGVCKREGCGKPQAGPTKGPHARLCEDHIAEQREARKATRAGTAASAREAKRPGPRMPTREEAIGMLRAWHEGCGKAPTQAV